MEYWAVKENKPQIMFSRSSRHKFFAKKKHAVVEISIDLDCATYFAGEGMLVMTTAKKLAVLVMLLGKRG
jgi:hypothetical protein